MDSPFPMVASDQPVDSVVKLLSKSNPAVLVQEHGSFRGSSRGPTCCIHDVALTKEPTIE